MQNHWTKDDIATAWQRFERTYANDPVAYRFLCGHWGSGIPKLLESMREYGLRDPEFCDLEIGFRINLYRKAEEDRGHSENEKEPKQLCGRQPRGKCTEAYLPDEVHI